MKPCNNCRDFGILIIRVGIGIMFITHGAPKLLMGPEGWEKLGMAVGNLGIHFLPAFWGFMAAASESIGGLCLILGLFVRPAATLLLCTMIVASVMHFSKGDGLKGASHAMENGIVFLSLVFIGAGKYSLDALLFPGKTKSCDDAAGRSSAP